MLQKKKDEWFAKILVGEIACPMDGCTWRFFTPYELGYHLNGNCDFGNYSDTLPCTHCEVMLKCDELKDHMVSRHRDICHVLFEISEKEGSSCPNYKCKKYFKTGFEEGIAYLKHSIKCLPCFRCKKCHREFANRSYMTLYHKCSSADKKPHRKSVSLSEVNIDRDLTKDSGTKGNEKAIIEKWFNTLKSGNFMCPVPNCSKKYFVARNFITHLNYEAKIEKKLFSMIEDIPCLYCNQYIRYHKLPRHFQENHRAIQNILTKLKEGETVKCPNYLCPDQASFTPSAGYEYLAHAVKCKPLFRCMTCGTESRTEKYLKSHKCGSKKQRERWKKVKAEMLDSSYSDSTVKKVGYGIRKTRNKTQRSNIDMEIKMRTSAGNVKEDEILRIKKEMKEQNPSASSQTSTVENFTTWAAKRKSASTSTIVTPPQRTKTTVVIPPHSDVASSQTVATTDIEAMTSSIETTSQSKFTSKRRRSVTFAETPDSDLTSSTETVSNAKQPKSKSSPTRKSRGIQSLRIDKEKAGDSKSPYGKTLSEPKHRIRKFGYGSKKAPDASPLSSKSKEKLTPKLPTIKTKAKSSTSKGTPGKSAKKVRIKRRKELKEIETTPTEFSTDDHEHLNEGITLDGLFTPVVIRSDETASSYQTMLEELRAQQQDQTAGVDNETEICLSNLNKKEALRDGWLKDFQHGVWRCIQPNCKKTFFLPFPFYKHLKECPKSDIKDLIFASTIKVTCCLCQEAMPVQRFTRHVKKHDNVFKHIADETSSFPCIYSGCEQSFEVGEDYLFHTISCPVKQKDAEEVKERERKKALLKKWLANFQIGVFDCGNASCQKAFEKPSELIQHLETCTVDSVNDKILQSKLDCQWCSKGNMEPTEYPEHFQKEHHQIYLVTERSVGPYTCPHYNCNFEGHSSKTFIFHSLRCPACILCEDCKCTFKSYKAWKQHECILSDPVYFKRSLNLWYNQVCSGFLRCPNVSCNASFYLINEFVTHLRQCASKSKFCKEVVDRNQLRCSFCTAEFLMDELEEHHALEHSQIYKLLKDLKEGNKVTCLNYKCKKEFVDGIKYYHHASICKPLYHCSECPKEFNSRKEQCDHQCVVNKRKKDDRKSSNAININRNVAIISTRQDFTVLLTDWYKDLQNATYTCPNPQCHKNFKTHSMLIPHLSICKVDDACAQVLKDDKFFCCICKKEIELSDYTTHLNVTHPKIVTNLSRFDLTHTVRCSYPCKQLFHDRGKYLKHAASCPHAGASWTNINAFNKSKWLLDVENGNLYCPNRKCKEHFFIIEHFLQHLRNCMIGHTLLGPGTLKIPCLVCKDYFDESELAQHFRKEHTVVFAQLRLVSRGLCIHCPKTSCNEPFANGIIYLQHVATGCGTIPLYCDECKQTFETAALQSQHTCRSQEAVNPNKIEAWFEQIMKGNLHCPNGSCMKEFVLPRDFIEHLRRCRVGDETASVIVEQNELPCCFCKKYISFGKYCQHLKTCHQEKADKVSKSTSIRNAPVQRSISKSLIPDTATRAITIPSTTTQISPTSPTSPTIPQHFEQMVRVEEFDIREEEVLNDDVNEEEAESRAVSTTLTSEIQNVESVCEDPIEKSTNEEPSTVDHDAVLVSTSTQLHQPTIVEPSDKEIIDEAESAPTTYTVEDTVDEQPSTSKTKESVSPMGLLKVKLRRHSKGRAKRKLTDDVEVIDLVNQLIKRKKKKTRFLHNVSPSTGQWTVTNIPKKVKVEEAEHGDVQESLASISPKKTIPVVEVSSEEHYMQSPRKLRQRKSTSELGDDQEKVVNESEGQEPKRRKAPSLGLRVKVNKKGDSVETVQRITRSAKYAADFPPYQKSSSTSDINDEEPSKKTPVKASPPRKDVHDKEPSKERQAKTSQLTREVHDEEPSKDRQAKTSSTRDVHYKGPSNKTPVKASPPRKDVHDKESSKKTPVKASPLASDLHDDEPSRESPAKSILPEIYEPDIKSHHKTPAKLAPPKTDERDEEPSKKTPVKSAPSTRDVHDEKPIKKTPFKAAPSKREVHVEEPSEELPARLVALEIDELDEKSRKKTPSKVVPPINDEENEEPSNETPTTVDLPSSVEPNEEQSNKTPTKATPPMSVITDEEISNETPKEQRRSSRLTKNVVPTEGTDEQVTNCVLRKEVAVKKVETVEQRVLRSSTKISKPSSTPTKSKIVERSPRRRSIRLCKTDLKDTKHDEASTRRVLRASLTRSSTDGFQQEEIGSENAQTVKDTIKRISRLQTTKMPIEASQDNLYLNESKTVKHTKMSGRGKRLSGVLSKEDEIALSFFVEEPEEESPEPEKQSTEKSSGRAVSPLDCGVVLPELKEKPTIHRENLPGSKEMSVEPQEDLLKPKEISTEERSSEVEKMSKEPQENLAESKEKSTTEPQDKLAEQEKMLKELQEEIPLSKTISREPHENLPELEEISAEPRESLAESKDVSTTSYLKLAEREEIPKEDQQSESKDISTDVGVISAELERPERVEISLEAKEQSPSESYSKYKQDKEIDLSSNKVEVLSPLKQVDVVDDKIDQENEADIICQDESSDLDDGASIGSDGSIESGVFDSQNIEETIKDERDISVDKVVLDEKPVECRTSTDDSVVFKKPQIEISGRQDATDEKNTILSNYKQLETIICENEKRVEPNEHAVEHEIKTREKDDTKDINKAGFERRTKKTRMKKSDIEEKSLDRASKETLREEQEQKLVESKLRNRSLGDDGEQKTDPLQGELIETSPGIKPKGSRINKRFKYSKFKSFSLPKKEKQPPEEVAVLSSTENVEKHEEISTVVIDEQLNEKAVTVESVVDDSSLDDSQMDDIDFCVEPGSPTFLMKTMISGLVDENEEDSDVEIVASEETLDKEGKSEDHIVNEVDFDSADEEEKVSNESNDTNDIDKYTNKRDVTVEESPVATVLADKKDSEEKISGDLGEVNDQLERRSDVCEDDETESLKDVEKVEATTIPLENKSENELECVEMRNDSSDTKRESSEDIEKIDKTETLSKSQDEKNILDKSKDIETRTNPSEEESSKGITGMEELTSFKDVPDERIAVDEENFNIFDTDTKKKVAVSIPSDQLSPEKLPVWTKSTLFQHNNNSPKEMLFVDGVAEKTKAESSEHIKSSTGENADSKDGLESPLVSPIFKRNHRFFPQKSQESPQFSSMKELLSLKAADDASISCVYEEEKDQIEDTVLPDSLVQPRSPTFKYKDIVRSDAFVELRDVTETKTIEDELTSLLAYASRAAASKNKEDSDEDENDEIILTFDNTDDDLDDNGSHLEKIPRVSFEQTPVESFEEEFNITYEIVQNIDEQLSVMKTNVVEPKQEYIVSDDVKSLIPLDMASWSERIANLDYVCPKCDEKCLRILSLTQHMRKCLKTSTTLDFKDFLQQKLKCSECERRSTFDAMSYHFRTKHLLLHWYLGELEKGNWAICQNYKCGKYMDDPKDIRIHATNCKYLWKCKYCHIEFDKESRVRKHHCRDTSESEDNGEEKIKIKTEDITDHQHEELIAKQLTTGVIEDDVNQQIETESSTIMFSLNSDGISPPPTNQKPSLPQIPMKKTIIKEEPIVSLSKSDVIDGEKWVKSISNFDFKCPFVGCGKRTLFNGLRKHMTRSHTKILTESVFKMKTSCVITSCPQYKIEMTVDAFLKHVKSLHYLVVQSYNDFYTANNIVRCLNYECGKEIISIEEIGEHYIKCGVLLKCSHCGFIGKKAEEIEDHVCEILEDEPFEPEIEDGKRRKRKSAAKAMAMMSVVIESVNKINEEKRQRLENEGSDKGDDIGDNDYNDSDEEFEINRISSSSSDAEDDEIVDDLDDDSRCNERRGQVTRGKPAEAIKANYYDKEFFRSWLEKNKTDDLLFPTLMPKDEDLIVLQKSEYEKYLPKVVTSPLIEFEHYKKSGGKKVVPPRKLELFEATPALEESSTLGFFCGGDVWGMDWCPVSGKDEQYLAVTCHNTLIEHNSPIDCKSVPGLIQIWYIGKMNQNVQTKPKLVYGICHDYGPVYAIQWCPATYRSFEKIELKRRLGLLAIACGDGKVRVLSIPKPSNPLENDTIFCKINPELNLIPHKSNSFEVQRTGFCLCVRWHPSAPHRKIAAGYADGGVRIWDTLTKSMFLKIEENNIPCILPPITIYAHSYSVRSLDWCPYSKDIIATASCDKSFKILNINQPYNPIFVTKRGMFLDVVWPKTRLGLFVTEDECFNILPGSARYQVLENHFKAYIAEDNKRPLLTTRHRTAVWSCSYNDHLDLVATSDSSGDVVVCKDQDSQGTKYPKVQNKTEPVFHIEVEEIEESGLEEDENDGKLVDEDVCLSDNYKKQQEKFLKTCYNKYKFKMVDTNKYEFMKKRSPKDKDLDRVCFGHFKKVDDVAELETRSIHKVTWNSNFGSHTWLASGTRIGLVRLHNFKAWKT